MVLDSSSKQYFAQGSKNIIDAEYREKVIKNPWNPSSQAIDPPTGGFDPAYYIENNNYVKDAWDRATNNRIGGISVPDLDITARYVNLDTYANADYSQRVNNDSNLATTLRANAVTDIDPYSEAYNDLPDAIKAQYRDDLLGGDI